MFSLREHRFGVNDMKYCQVDARTRPAARGARGTRRDRARGAARGQPAARGAARHVRGRVRGVAPRPGRGLRVDTPRAPPQPDGMAAAAAGDALDLCRLDGGSALCSRNSANSTAFTAFADVKISPRYLVCLCRERHHSKYM